MIVKRFGKTGEVKIDYRVDYPLTPYRVSVDHSRGGLQDNPIQYPDGRIAYDYPERLSNTRKALVARAYRWINAMQDSWNADNDYWYQFEPIPANLAAVTTRDLECMQKRTAFGLYAIPGRPGKVITLPSGKVFGISTKFAPHERLYIVRSIVLEHTNTYRADGTEILNSCGKEKHYTKDTRS